MREGERERGMSERGREGERSERAREGGRRKREGGGRGREERKEIYYIYMYYSQHYHNKLEVNAILQLF